MHHAASDYCREQWLNLPIFIREASRNANIELTSPGVTLVQDTVVWEKDDRCMIEGLDLLKTDFYKKKLTQCIHCGLCLQACPTYTVFGTEMDAPHGRIALIQAASQDKIGLQDFKDGFTQHMQLCLACRSCETACPSGVQYGVLVEEARIVVEYNRDLSTAEQFLRFAGMQLLMTHSRLLKFVARLMWVYQSSGLQRLVRTFNFLPKTLKAMETILPPIQFKFTRLNRALLAEPEKTRPGVVFHGLHSGGPAIGGKPCYHTRLTT